jgi:anti-anti-sigma regulatory factor
MNKLFENPRSLQGDLTVVTAPTEIDIINADRLFYDLMSAARSASIVVLDMTATIFCDSSGFRRMTLAGDHLRGNGSDLRVVCSDRMHMLLSINKDDEHLSVFSSMIKALTPPTHSASELVPAA